MSSVAIRTLLPGARGPGGAGVQFFHVHLVYILLDAQCALLVNVRELADELARRFVARLLGEFVSPLQRPGRLLLVSRFKRLDALLDALGKFRLARIVCDPGVNHGALLLVVRPDGEHLPTFVQLDFDLLAALAVDQADSRAKLRVTHFADGRVIELDNDVEVACLLSPVAGRDPPRAGVGASLHLGREVEDLGSELLHHLDSGAERSPDLQIDVAHRQRLGPVENGREVVCKVCGLSNNIYRTAEGMLDETELIGAVGVADASALDFEKARAPREFCREWGVATFVVLAVRQEDEHANVAIAFRELAAGRREPLRELRATAVLGAREYSQGPVLVLPAGLLGGDDDVGFAPSDDDEELAVIGQLSDGFDERLPGVPPFLARHGTRAIAHEADDQLAATWLACAWRDQGLDGNDGVHISRAGPEKFVLVYDT